MQEPHPKYVRRVLLERLYERYMQDPLDMMIPSDLLEDTVITRANLVPNIHYLHDRGLVELMLGFSAPMFDGVRITADGVDLVENVSEFGLRFPGVPGGAAGESADIPAVMERLVEEADLCALDGEARRALLRDIQYLREELARPVRRWRSEVIGQVLDWIDGHFSDGASPLPSLNTLRALLERDARP